MSLQASSDMSILDFDIPYSISFVLAGGVEAAMVIIVMATVTWQVLIVATPVTILMIYIQVTLAMIKLHIICNFLEK